MEFSLSKLTNRISERLSDSLKIRFRRGAIGSVDELCEFVETRAAYVAQTSLYGYLKNRMGIKYPEMFADETMAASIDLAKWRTYGSCLADLSNFAAATAGAQDRLADEQKSRLAQVCFERAVSRSFDQPEAIALLDEINAVFDKSKAELDWANAAEGENAFLNSPVDLVRHAPIADELKELDVDIVVNSTRFRWRDIRKQLRDRIDRDAVSADWLGTHADTGL